MFDISLTGKSVRITIERDIFETMGPVAVINEAKNIMEHVGLVPFGAVVDENFKPKKATTVGRVTCVFDYTPSFYKRIHPTFDIMRAIRVIAGAGGWIIECPFGSSISIDKEKNKLLTASVDGKYCDHDFSMTFYKSASPMVSEFICSNLKLGDDEFTIAKLLDPLLMLVENDMSIVRDKRSHLTFNSRPVFVAYQGYMYVDCGHVFDAESEVTIGIYNEIYRAEVALGTILRISMDSLTPTYTDIKSNTVLEAYCSIAAVAPTNTIATGMLSPDACKDWFTLRGWSYMTSKDATDKFIRRMVAEGVRGYVMSGEDITSSDLHHFVDEIVKCETSNAIWKNYSRNTVAPDLMGSPLSSVNRQVRQPLPESNRSVPSPAAVFDAIAHYIKSGRYGNIAEAFIDIATALREKREWSRYVNHADLVNVSEAFLQCAQKIDPQHTGTLVVPGEPLSDVMINTIREIVASTPVTGLRGRINIGECIDILTDIDQHIRNEVMKTPFVW